MGSGGVASGGRGGATSNLDTSVGYSKTFRLMYGMCLSDLRFTFCGCLDIGLKSAGGLVVFKNPIT